MRASLASLAQERFTTSLLTTFAGLAVLLAAVGLYAVFASSPPNGRRPLRDGVGVGTFLTISER